MLTLSPNNLIRELLEVSSGGHQPVNYGQLCEAAAREIIRLRQVAKDKAVRTLVPWYGGNRTNTELVGQLLAGCELVAVPFAGGMPELLSITARQVLVSDIHREVIALAESIADPVRFGILLQRLSATPFHEDILNDAQSMIRQVRDGVDLRGDDVAWAYFVTSWFGRSGNAGTANENEQSMAVRYTTSGGDSAVRVRSAIVGLYAFHEAFQRCSFLCCGFEELLARINDEPSVGIYCDPPWFEVGNLYRHKFTPQQHARLADQLGSFQRARIVVRINDHPETWQLYPSDEWAVRTVTGRTSAGTRDEVYLCRRVPAEQFAKDLLSQEPAA